MPAPERSTDRRRRFNVERLGIAALTTLLSTLSGDSHHRDTVALTQPDAMGEHKPPETPAIDNSVQRQHFEANFVPLRYPTEFREVTPPAVRLVQLLSEFQMVTLSAFTVESTISQADLEQRKTQLWSELKKIIPNLPDFSSANYQRFIMLDVPSLLAPYGIAMNNTALVRYGPDNTFSHADLAYSFYGIDHVQPVQQSLWGRVVDTQIVTLGNTLPFDPYPEVGEQFTPGDVFSANVVYIRTRQSQVDYQANVDAFQSADVQAVLQRKDQVERQAVARQVPEKQRQAAFAAARTQALRRYSVAEKSYQGHFNTKILHELGHVAQLADPAFKAVDMPPLTTDARIAEQHRWNREVHAEIYAILTELRYTQQPAETMYSFLDGATKYIMQTAPEDFKHGRAYVWIIDQMVEAIQRQPNEYGFVGDANESIIEANQIILFLPGLIDQPKKLNALLEKIQAGYDVRQVSVGAEHPQMKQFR